MVAINCARSSGKGPPRGLSPRNSLEWLERATTNMVVSLFIAGTAIGASAVFAWWNHQEREERRRLEQDIKFWVLLTGLLGGSVLFLSVSLYAVYYFMKERQAPPHWVWTFFTAINPFYEPPQAPMLSGEVVITFGACFLFVAIILFSIFLLLWDSRKETNVNIGLLIQNSKESTCNCCSIIFRGTLFLAVVVVIIAVLYYQVYTKRHYMK